MANNKYDFSDFDAPISNNEKTSYDFSDFDITPTSKESTIADKLLAGTYGLGQGASFGLSDELAGLSGAAIEKISGSEDPISKLYEEYRDAARQEYKAKEEIAPTTYTAAELASGFAIPGGAMANVGKLGKAGILAAQGALAGSGYSEAETIPELATDVAIGAGTSLAVAPLIGASKFALAPAENIKDFALRTGASAGVGAGIGAGYSAATGQDILEGAESGAELGLGAKALVSGARGAKEVAKRIPGLDFIEKGFQKGVEGVDISSEQYAKDLKTTAEKIGKEEAAFTESTLEKIRNNKTLTAEKLNEYIANYRKGLSKGYQELDNSLEQMDITLDLSPVITAFKEKLIINGLPEDQVEKLIKKTLQDDATFKSAQASKKQLEKLKDSSDPRIKDAAMSAYSELNNSIADVTEAIAPDVAKTYKQLNKDWALTSNIQEYVGDSFKTVAKDADIRKALDIVEAPLSENIKKERSFDEFSNLLKQLDETKASETIEQLSGKAAQEQKATEGVLKKLGRSEFERTSKIAKLAKESGQELNTDIQFLLDEYSKLKSPEAAKSFRSKAKNLSEDYKLAELAQDTDFDPTYTKAGLARGVLGGVRSLGTKASNIAGLAANKVQKLASDNNYLTQYIDKARQQGKESFANYLEGLTTMDNAKRTAALFAAQQNPGIRKDLEEVGEEDGF